MAEVIIQENESLENALRRFKRKVQQEDIIKEIKKHSFYMKPGEKAPGQRSAFAEATAQEAATRIGVNIEGGPSEWAALRLSVAAWRAELFRESGPR